MSVVFIAALIAMVISLYVRVRGRKLLDESAELMRMKHSPGSGKKKEKAIFGVVSRRNLPAGVALTAFERPLDIAPDVPVNQVLPPPEPVQGVNAGNEVI